MFAKPSFESEDMETRFNQYVSTVNSRGGTVAGAILSSVFKLERQFDNDPVQNLKELQAFLARLNWEQVRQVQSTLNAHPLTQRATTTDLLLAAIEQGLTQLASTNNGLL